MLNSNVAIVGCGVAGVSASIELQKRNIPHTIFESKRFIGGRFYSFFDSNLDFEIENGQHIFSTAYFNFFEILSYLKTSHSLSPLKKFCVPFVNSDGRIARLQSFAIHNQLGFFLGLLKFPFFSIKSKMNLLKFLYKLNTNYLNTTNHISAKDFLLSNHQNEDLLSSFWEPIGVSIFNNDLENIPSALFFETFKKAFLGLNPSFVFSTVGSSSLLKPFTEKLKNLTGSKIYFNKTVKSIFKDNERFIIYTIDGEKFEFNNIILCIPPHHLPNILPKNWLNSSYFNFLKVLTYNPIVSIYATFDKVIIDEIFAFMLNSPFHWIFNKNKIHNHKKNIFLFTFTTSNGKQLIEYTSQEIIHLLQKQLENHFPNTKGKRILEWKIIKDKFATINLDLDFIKYRPTQESPIEGLYFAGDWTDTNLPATLESAALSGKLAVRSLLNKYGKQ